MVNSQLRQTLGIQVKMSMSFSSNCCIHTCGKLYEVHTVDGINSTGYQIGRPLVAGVVQAQGNDTDVLQRSSIDLWKPGNVYFLALVFFKNQKISRLMVNTYFLPCNILLLTAGDGFCLTAEKEPVLYGHNSTAGCLLPVSLQNLSQCDSVRSVVPRQFCPLKA